MKGLCEASQNEHRATARAIWQAQSDERVARAISQEPFRVEIYSKNAQGHLRDTHFVRACAVEMHMDISQEPFCAEIFRKMPDAPDTTSIEHWALTIIPYEPLSVATLFGEKC